MFPKKHLYAAVLVGAAFSLVFGGCASPSASASRPPVVTANQAGRIQTAKTGTVQLVTECVIEPDLGPNYSVGRQVGSAVARVSPLGVLGAVGGAVGRSVEKGYRTQPGQMIEVQLDDGTVVTVAQDLKPPFYGGERVKLVMIGNQARIELLEDEPKPL